MRWHHAKFFNYEYAFCPSKEEWDTYWIKGGSTPPSYIKAGGRATFFQTENHDGELMSRAIVTISDNISGPLEVVAILAHEAVHIKQDICEYIQEKSLSSEMEAYIVQAILQDLLYAYKDTRL